MGRLRSLLSRVLFWRNGEDEVLEEVELEPQSRQQAQGGKAKKVVVCKKCGKEFGGKNAGAKLGGHMGAHREN